MKRKIILRIEKKGKGKHWVKSGEVSTGKGVETEEKCSSDKKKKKIKSQEERMGKVGVR